MISTLKALLWVRSFVIVVFIWGIYAAVKGHQRTCMFAYSLVCFVPFLFLVLGQDFVFFLFFFSDSRSISSHPLSFYCGYYAVPSVSVVVTRAVYQSKIPDALHVRPEISQFIII